MENRLIYKKHNRKVHDIAGPDKLAFTLVELIVVITILAILGTIAFIALQGYSASARDSKRLSDISNIKTSLELFVINSGKYPIPDDGSEVKYSTGGITNLVWTQGVLGDSVTTNLSKNLNKKPTDPLTGLEYTYSRTAKGNEYELLGMFESELVSFSSPLPMGEGLGVRAVNAADQSYVKVDGTYNQIYVQTDNFYIPTPSIINAEVSGTGILMLDDSNITSQVITGGSNVPQVGSESSSTGGLTNFPLLSYSGTISSSSTDKEKADLGKVLVYAYSESPELSSQAVYANIVNTDTTTTALASLTDTIVLNSVDASYSSESITLYTNIDGSQTPYLPDSASGSVRFNCYLGTCPGGDGVVLDNITGLMWQSDGISTGSMNWVSAKSYCASLDLGGYFDWRLPDYTELLSIVDLSKSSPSLDTNYFWVYNVSYWSSNTDTSNNSNAWVVLFGDGTTGSYDKGNPTRVRCIR